MNEIADFGKGVVVVKVGRHFDSRFYGMFMRACCKVQDAKSRRIVIDFARTRSLHESGLALLMMLYDRAWCLREDIELVNCSPALRACFGGAVYPGIFRIT